MRRRGGVGERDEGASARAFIGRFLRGDPMTVARVSGLARRVIGSQAYAIPIGDREDIVQETLLQVHQALLRPGADRSSSMAALVRTVTHRRCIDWRRARRPQVELDPGLASRSRPADEILITSEMLERGRRVIESLTPACQDLLRMRARDGLSHREIAARLETSEGAVRTRLHKCLKNARSRLAELEAKGGSAPSDGGGS